VSIRNVRVSGSKFLIQYSNINIRWLSGISIHAGGVRTLSRRCYSHGICSPVFVFGSKRRRGMDFVSGWVSL
jgi:hypothetical protein